MKGVIFNVVEEVVTEAYGADTWDALLDAAGVDGAYTALGNYDDAQLVALVAAASDALGASHEEVLRLVGRAGFERLSSRYPHFVESHDTSRTVLRELNSVIHPQVLTIYPDASVPRFEVTGDDRQLVLTYESARGLCHLAEGLAEGLATAFDERVTLHQRSCRHRGDDTCEIIVDYLDGR